MLRMKDSVVQFVPRSFDTETHKPENAVVNPADDSTSKKTIVDGINEIAKKTGGTESYITQMSNNMYGFTQTVNSLANASSELGPESDGNMAAIDSIAEQCAIIRKCSARIAALTDRLNNTVSSINSLSWNNG